MASRRWILLITFLLNVSLVSFVSVGRPSVESVATPWVGRRTVDSAAAPPKPKHEPEKSP